MASSAGADCDTLAAAVAPAAGAACTVPASARHSAVQNADPRCTLDRNAKAIASIWRASQCGFTSRASISIPRSGFDETEHLGVVDRALEGLRGRTGREQHHVAAAVRLGPWPAATNRHFLQI